MKGAAVVLFIMIGYASTAEDECGSCLPNGFICISEREFKLCNGKDLPVNGNVFNCSENQVCTNMTDVCMEKNSENPEIVANCQKSSDQAPKLGVCEDCVKDFPFACIGRTTYALCMGKIGKGEYNPDAIADCPENYICNTNTTEIFSAVAKYIPYYPCIPSCSVSIFDFITIMT